MTNTLEAQLTQIISALKLGQNIVLSTDCCYYIINQSFNITDPNLELFINKKMFEQFTHSAPHNVFLNLLFDCLAPGPVSFKIPLEGQDQVVTTITSSHFVNEILEVFAQPILAKALYSKSGLLVTDEQTAQDCAKEINALFIDSGKSTYGLLPTLLEVDSDSRKVNILRAGSINPLEIVKLIPGSYDLFFSNQNLRLASPLEVTFIDNINQIKSDEVNYSLIASKELLIESAIIEPFNYTHLETREGRLIINLGSQTNYSSILRNLNYNLSLALKFSRGTIYFIKPKLTKQWESVLTGRYLGIVSDEELNFAFTRSGQQHLLKRVVDSKLLTIKPLTNL